MNTIIFHGICVSGIESKTKFEIFTDGSLWLPPCDGVKLIISAFQKSATLFFVNRFTHKFE